MTLLRPARPDEIARCCALEQMEDHAPFVTTNTPDEHARAAARDDTTYLAIERDGAFDGYVILVLDPDGRSVELRRIVVLRKNNGTGQAALGAAVGYCRDTLGRERVWLDCWQGNPRGLHIYAKHGFTPIDAPPNADAETLFFAKDL